MGCLCLKPTRNDESLPLSTPQYSWDREGRPDPSRLIISGEEGGVVGRVPGEVSGRQFMVQKCKGSSIFVLDNTETVTISKCEGCQIFIGPCRTSVSIRECSDCRCVVACQQFRSRDCTKCEIFLHCSSQPVIESCSKMKFTCFQASYPQLKGQFSSANLSVFNNQWSVIHDFTRGLEESNWTLIKEDAPSISIPNEGQFAEIGLSFSREESVVPFTVGPKQKPTGESCLVVFFANEDLKEKAMTFVKKLHAKAVLVLSKEVSLKPREAEALFSGSADLTTAASRGTCILLEVVGRDCINLCKENLEDVALEDMYLSPNSEQGLKDTEAFNNFNEMSLTMQ